MISELAGKEGPVACKSLALCYWAGKEPQIDFFNTDQATLMGAIPLERLLKPIEERRYAAIQLGDSTYNYAATKSQILPAEVNEAIARGYVVADNRADERVRAAHIGVFNDGSQIRAGDAAVGHEPAAEMGI